MTQIRDERIAAAFERLFRTYDRSLPGTGDEVARERMERAKVYFEAVSSYEAEDVETAVSNFLAGAAPGHNPSFAPPAPLVGSEVLRVRNLRLDRTRERRPRLPPPDVQRSPESMARVAALTAQTVEKLGASMRTEDAEKDRRMREQLAKTNERFAPDMSPEAQRGRLLRRDWGYDVGEARQAAEAAERG